MSRTTLAVSVALTLAAGLSAGCASNPSPKVPPGPSPAQQYRQDLQNALAHPDPEMRLSALGAVNAPNRSLNLERLSVAAHLALEAGTFPSPGARLAEATAGLPLHQVPRETQALAYLGARVAERDDARTLATATVRAAVDGACAPLQVSDLKHALLDAGQMARERFYRSLRQACFEYARGDAAAAKRELFRAMVTADAERSLINELKPLGTEGSARLAVRWLYHRLAQAGIHLERLAMLP